MTLTDTQKKVSKIVIPAIIIVLIVVLALTGGKKSDKKNTEDTGLITAQSMQPVVEDDFEYSFEGIRWNYAPSQSGDMKGAQTKVGFFFTNFTRHKGGAPVSFARPYHIGWYAGDCSIETEVPINSSIRAYGTPLAFTECKSDEENTFVGLFQDGDMITAYSWKSLDDEPLFIREIDLTTVVRPSNTGAIASINQSDSFEEDSATTEAPFRRRSVSSGGDQ